MSAKLAEYMAKYKAAQPRNRTAPTKTDRLRADRLQRFAKGTTAPGSAEVDSGGDDDDESSGS